jgi:phosphosulfolactate phosphohydrolase-like enzyme
MTNPTTSDLRDKLQADVDATLAEIERLRTAKAERKEAADRDVSEEERLARRQISADLNKARERLDQARELLERFDKSGQEHAVVVHGNRAVGTIAMRVPPGSSQETRLQLIEEALEAPLEAAASKLGVVLSAGLVRYVRERSGRDSEGRTVLDVEGVVEGDLLIPSVRTPKKQGGRGR